MPPSRGRCPIRRASRRSRSTFLEEKNAGDTLLPYKRDAKGARPWIKPGTPGLMHRIGGIEKHVDTGNIDYSPANHQAMTDARKAKIDGIAVPDQEVALGEATGRLAVVGWGSTFGPIHQAVRRARKQGLAVSHIHVRHVWPLPKNLGALLAGLRQGAGARDEHRPVQDRAARPAAGRRRAADQDQRPAVRDRRARSGDRQVLRRHPGQRGRRGRGQRRPAARAGVRPRRRLARRARRPERDDP